MNEADQDKFEAAVDSAEEIQQQVDAITEHLSCICSVEVLSDARQELIEAKTRAGLVVKMLEKAILATRGGL